MSDRDRHERDGTIAWVIGLLALFILLGLGGGAFLLMRVRAERAVRADQEMMMAARDAQEAARQAQVEAQEKAAATAQTGLFAPSTVAPTVKLGKVPSIALQPRTPLTEEQMQQIKELIAQLAELDKPDLGPTDVSARVFAPIKGHVQFDSILLTNHHHQPSETMRKLVAFGPNALPFLLEALEDKTPTRIKIERPDAMRSVTYGSHLPGNPVNPFEAEILERRAKEKREQRSTQEHTVTIGDVCFIAIGQIVGRSYQAVSFQPTADLVINSPTADPQLLADVRAIWTSKDPTQRLFDSLLFDYATEGIFNGELQGGWDRGNALQCAAALRLLYYFPKESATLIAERVSKLNVEPRGDPDDPVDGWLQQTVANGVRADHFIKAIAWCQDPAIRAAVVDVSQRTQNNYVFLATIPAIEDQEVLKTAIEARLAQLPATEKETCGEGFRLLEAYAGKFPDSLRTTCERYLRDADVTRCQTVFTLLEQIKVPWDKDILLPLLADKRPIVRDNHRSRLPLRVCDAAAWALAKNDRTVQFELMGSHAELDKQIAALREQLERK